MSHCALIVRNIFVGGHLLRRPQLCRLLSFSTPMPMSPIRIIPLSYYSRFNALSPSIVNLPSLTHRNATSSLTPIMSRYLCTEPPKPKPGLWRRFKDLWKKYYYVVLPVHIITSAGWFAIFYFMASRGFDVVAFVQTLSFIPDSLAEKIQKIPKSAGNVATAYALYKIASPARYAVTIAGTHYSIRALAHFGLIPTAKEVQKASSTYIYKHSREARIKFHKRFGSLNQGTIRARISKIQSNKSYHRFRQWRNRQRKHNGNGNGNKEKD